MLEMGVLTARPAPGVRWKDAETELHLPIAFAVPSEMTSNAEELTLSVHAELKVFTPTAFL